MLESLDDEEPKARFHSVNCVSAMLFCNECASDINLSDMHANITTDVNSNCVCRKNADPERRMVTWINGIDGCIDALESFITWLFTGIGIGLERSHTTYVMAHCCGQLISTFSNALKQSRLDTIFIFCLEPCTDGKIWLHKLYAAEIRFLC